MYPPPPRFHLYWGDFLLLVLSEGPSYMSLMCILFWRLHCEFPMNVATILLIHKSTRIPVAPDISVPCSFNGFFSLLRNQKFIERHTPGSVLVGKRDGFHTWKCWESNSYCSNCEPDPLCTISLTPLHFIKAEPTLDGGPLTCPVLKEVFHTGSLPTGN